MSFVEELSRINISTKPSYISLQILESEREVHSLFLWRRDDPERRIIWMAAEVDRGEKRDRGGKEVWMAAEEIAWQGL
jgi:hypothetical protein